MDSYMDLTMPQLLIPSFIFRLSSFVLRRITSEELENPIFPKIPPYNH